MRVFVTVIISLLCFSAEARTEEYWVTQLRATPGQFQTLLDTLKTTDWQNSIGSKPIVMRHSQGDQWDVMLLGTIGKSCTNAKCFERQKLFHSLWRTSLNHLVDFELTFEATSDTDWATLQLLNETASLYHIEMFNAAAGKHDALMRQRHMENDYLAKTGQQTNVIFKVTRGSDVDAFTIGFHESLQTFAESPDLPVEAFEKAAIAAGFKNRADISFHLRELIVGHHDTLATKVATKVE